MERNCLNCRYGLIVKLDKGDIISCREEPGVVDHAFNISTKDAETHVCECHKFRDTVKKFKLSRSQLVDLFSDVFQTLASNHNTTMFELAIDTEGDHSYITGVNGEK